MLPAVASARSLSTPLFAADRVTIPSAVIYCLVCWCHKSKGLTSKTIARSTPALLPLAGYSDCCITYFFWIVLRLWCHKFWTGSCRWHSHCWVPYWHWIALKFRCHTYLTGSCRHQWRAAVVRGCSGTIFSREMYIQWREISRWSIIIATQCPWIILRDGGNVWGHFILIVHISEAQQQRVNTWKCETSFLGLEKIFQWFCLRESELSLWKNISSIQKYQLCFKYIPPSRFISAGRCTIGF